MPAWGFLRFTMFWSWIGKSQDSQIILLENKYFSVAGAHQDCLWFRKICCDFPRFVWDFFSEFVWKLHFKKWGAGNKHESCLSSIAALRNTQKHEDRVGCLIKLQGFSYYCRQIDPEYRSEHSGGTHIFLTWANSRKPESMKRTMWISPGSYKPGLGNH